MTYKDFFKNKKMAVVGLGPRFEMVADIKFLIKIGADITLYDMRSEKSCRHVLAELIDAGLTKYVFSIASSITSDVTSKITSETKSDDVGKSTNNLADDLATYDLIILSPDMPLDASFLAKARDNAVGESRPHIEYPQTLFLKLAPPITLIGILGSCGKTTVSNMIFSVLKKAFEEYKDQGIYYLDPETPLALSHLKKVRKGDLVVARVTRSLIPAYEEARVSPHIAVFTTLSTTLSAPISASMSSAMSAPLSSRNGTAAHRTLATIFNILEFQTYNNFIIGNDVVIDEIRENHVIEPKAKMLRTSANIVPSDWQMRHRGIYDRENVALAVRTAELFKIPLETSRGVLEGWKGLKGRLELVKRVAGIEFYNDTASSVPTATLAALRSISENKNVVLIMGGAAMSESHAELIENIPQYVSSLVLIPGSGTLGIRRDVKVMAESSGLKCHYAHSIEEAVRIAREKSARGDRVLFSPGFEACGVEKSRSERGNAFVKAVRGL